MNLNKLLDNGISSAIDIITSFGVKENIVDLCIYLRISGVSLIIILVLYTYLKEILSSWHDWIFKFRFCQICGYTKIHFWLFVPISWKRNFMKMCEVVYCCCIHYEGWICSMLWGYNSWFLWLQNFISRLGIVDSIAKPLRIYCHNFVVVFFSTNNKYFKGAKLMKLKYFVVKEEVQKQNVSINYISSKLMIAYLLTKGLPPKTFNNHAIRIHVSRYHYWNQDYVIWHFKLICLLFMILSHGYVLMISIYINELY